MGLHLLKNIYYYQVIVEGDLPHVNENRPEGICYAFDRAGKHARNLSRIFSDFDGVVREKVGRVKDIPFQAKSKFPIFPVG